MKFALLTASCGLTSEIVLVVAANKLNTHFEEKQIKATKRKAKIVAVFGIINLMADAYIHLIQLNTLQTQVCALLFVLFKLVNFLVSINLLANFIRKRNNSTYENNETEAETEKESEREKEECILNNTNADIIVSNEEVIQNTKIIDILGFLIIGFEATELLVLTIHYFIKAFKLIHSTSLYA